MNNSPISWIFFPRSRIWVRSGQIKVYTRWLVRQYGLRAPRQWLRGLHSPRRHRSLPGELSGKIAWLKANYSFETSWARYPTDSTRWQFFDAQARKVAKVSKQSFDKTRNEILVRGRFESLCAPLVFASDPGKGVLIEEWIDGATLPATKDRLAQLLNILATTLYRPSKMTLAEACHKCDWKLPPGISLDSLAERLGEIYLPISQIHGDMTPDNVIFSRQKPVLLDWEYTRLGITSYDAWAYTLLSAYSQKSNLLLNGPDLFHKLADTFSYALSHLDSTSFSGSIPISQLNLLHLIERYSLLAQLDQRSTVQLRDHLAVLARKELHAL